MLQRRVHSFKHQNDAVVQQPITFDIVLEKVTADETDVDLTAIQTTIQPNVLSKTIQIPTYDDILESDETIKISVSNVSNAKILDISDTALVTIIDNDMPYPISRNGFILNPTFEMNPNFDLWTLSGSAPSTSSDIAVPLSGTILQK